MSDLDNAIIKILDSIAEEEQALAKLVAAESKKINFVLAKNPTNHEIIALNKSVSGVLNTILMKEIVLLQKLKAAIPHIPIHEENESSSESSSESSCESISESSERNDEKKGSEPHIKKMRVPKLKPPKPKPKPPKDRG